MILRSLHYSASQNLFSMLVLGGGGGLTEAKRNIEVLSSSQGFCTRICLGNAAERQDTCLLRLLPAATVCERRERREARAARKQTQPRESHAPFSRQAVKTTEETSPSAQLLHIKDNACIFSRFIKLLCLRFISGW